MNVMDIFSTEYITYYVLLYMNYLKINVGT